MIAGAGRRKLVSKVRSTCERGVEHTERTLDDDFSPLTVGALILESSA